MPDPFDLQRYLTAQESIYNTVLAELSAGQKNGHWMWFIFPQLRGLGSSAMAWEYGIASLEEARAYLNHPILGSRLRQCVRLALAVDGRTAEAISGYPDYLKFRSCLTLFEAAEGEGVFWDALGKFYGGVRDGRTLELLARG